MVVLLGFQDEKMKTDEITDWSINKIGGTPDFMTELGDASYPRCVNCDAWLHLLCQIYCPLSESCYHRTIYIFACTNRSCWNKASSIVVLRCQKLEEKKAKETETKISNDDWGMNDWCDTKDSEEDIQVNVDDSVASLSAQLGNQLSFNENYKLFPHFVGYYISVTNEKDMQHGLSTEYEMKLYQEYLNREGCTSVHNGSSSSSGNESYEKTKVKHGDELFHRFKKRVKDTPHQCLRYEHNGSPLYYSSQSQPEPEEILKCQNCGSQRIFELQLMPHLVTCLYKKKNENVCLRKSKDNKDEMKLILDSVEDDVEIDFCCIFIYTCKSSCWNESDQFHHELAVIQTDPDEKVIK